MKSKRKRDAAVCIAVAECLESRRLLSGTDLVGAQLQSPSGAAAGSDFRLNAADTLPQAAALDTWIGPTTGAWDTSGNWSLGIPIAGEAVSIGAGFTVSAAGTDVAGALTTAAGSTLQVTGGSLTLSGAASLSGALKVGAGTLAAQGNTISASAVTLSGGAITGTSSLTSTGLFTWSGGTLNIPNTTAGGGLVIAGNGTLFLTSGTLSIPSGQSATMNGGDAVLEINNGTLSIGGTFTAGSGAEVFDNGGTDAINNNGTFDVTGAFTLTSGVALNNSGTVEVESGTLSLDGGGAATGATYLLDASGTLSLSNGTFAFDSASTIRGGGVAAFQGGTETINGAYDITGTTSFSGANATFATGSTITSLGNGTLAVASGSVSFDSSIAGLVSGAVTVSGTVNLGANILSVTTVNLTADGFTGTGSIRSSGLFTWSGGTLAVPSVTVNGGLNITGDGVFLNGGTLTIPSGQTATMTGTSDVLELTNGIIDNAGAFTAGGDEIFDNGGTDAVNNSGTFDVTGAFTLTSGVPFNNSGTAEVESGTLTLSGGSTGVAATYLVDSGATLNVSNGTFSFDTATNILGAGTVTFSGGTNTVNGTYDITGRTTFTGGATTFSAGSTVTSLGNGSLTVSSGSVIFDSSISGIITGAVTIGGTVNLGTNNLSVTTVNLTSGGITGTGTLTSSGLFSWSGGTLAVPSTTVNGGLSITGEGVFFNGGTLTIPSGQTAAMTGSSDVLELNNGIIDNAGAFTASGDEIFDNGGTVAVNNSGTFNVTGPFTLSNGVPFNNSGILNLQTSLADNGGFTQTSAGTTQISIGGTAAGQFSTLAVNGSASLAGALTVTFTNGFTPAVGNSFKVLTVTSSINGQFSKYNGVVNGSTYLSPVYQAADLLLNAAAADTWIGPTTGTWDTPGNWSLGIPTAGEVVSIGAGFTVSAAGTDVAGALTTASTSALEITAGSLTLSGPATFDGALDLSAGTLNAQGNAITVTTANFSGGTLNGVTIDGSFQVASDDGIVIENGLTLNGTVTLGNNGTGYGYLEFEGTQTLGGSATVVFGSSSPANALWEDISGGTLTIGSDITVQGQSGYVGYDPSLGGSANVAVVNQGTIDSDGGGTITIDGTGIQSSTALVAGSGSAIALVGMVNGGTLGVSGAGAFNLAQVELNGVTIDGSFQVASDDGIVIENGLTLNGTVTLGNNGTGYGYLEFEGTQTLGGSATVVFGSSSPANALWEDISGGTLTIGSDITVQGQSGYVGYDPSLGGSANVAVVNQGTIDSDGGGTITVNGQGGVFTNSGTVNASLGAIGVAAGTYGAVNNGAVAVGPSGTLTITGPFTQLAPGNLNVVLGGSTTSLYGQVAISGTAALNGNLNVSEANGFTPATGSTFTVLTYTSATGQFSKYNGVVNGSTYLSPVYQTTDLLLTAVPTSAPSISSAPTATFTTGAAGAFTITTTAAPSAALTETGALPSDVTFVDNGNGTATISGTPTAETGGIYFLNLTAANGVSPNATQTLTLTVDQPSSITSASTATFATGVSSSFEIAAAGFPTPILTVTGNLPRGLMFISPSAIAAASQFIVGTPAAGSGGDYPISVTASNGVGSTATQTLNLVVDQSPAITSASAATFVIGAANSFTVTASGFPIAAISESGSLPSGLSFADNGNGTATLSGMPAASAGGTYSLTLTAANAVAANATQTFTLTINEPPAVTSAVRFGFSAGTSATFTVTTQGFPTAAISESGLLPSGVLFVDNGNGTATLSGTPAMSADGVYTLTITASNGVSPNATQTFTLSVGEAPVIVQVSNPTFTVGQNGSITVTTTGFPAPALSESGPLPGGVSFVDNQNGTATLSGAPQAGSGGTYVLAIVAGNSISPNATQTITLTVNQSPAITSSSGGSFTLDTAGTFTITTSGFPAPALTESGDLPQGVTFVDNGNGTATLSGTPTEYGAFGVTITASNGVSPDAVQSLTLGVIVPVGDSGPAITSANSVIFAAGIANSFTVTAAGQPAPSLSETGTLPSGVTFTDNGNGTATLAGMPSLSVATTVPLTIQASNGVGSPVTQSFTLSVEVPTITESNGVITGDGTDVNDTASVSYSNGNVVITIDGVTQTFGMSSVSAIDINLGAGNDSITVGAGAPAVSIAGGAGDDSLKADNSAADTMSGGAGNDTIVGGGKGSQLLGNGGADLIDPSHHHESVVGGAANDTISGAGHDSLRGGAGDDIFLDSGEKKDSINGGAGLNFALNNPDSTMQNIFQPIDPTPPSSGGNAVVPTAGPAAAPANASAVVVGGIVEITGTPGADTISISSDGTNLNVEADGSSLGAFALSGVSSVFVSAKGGRDTVSVDSSVTLPCTLMGGAGGDSLQGGGGDNVLVGGGGSDTIVGGSGTNLLVGGQLMVFSNSPAGNDILDGGTGFSIADFSYRTDPLKLSNDGTHDSGDPQFGESITIDANVSAIWGGTANDTITGGVPGVFLSGGDGANSIHGGGANDLLVGGGGNDTVIVAAEPVSLYLLNGSPNEYGGVNNPSEDILQLDSLDTELP